MQEPLLPSTFEMYQSLYEIFLQPNVSHDLSKLAKKAKVRYNAVRKALDTMINDVRESIPLIDPMFYGLKRAKADEDRIIFQICSECRGNEAIKKMRKCIDCEQIPENGIKVFDIDDRRTVYSKWKVH